MHELSTPKEIIEKIALLCEKERKTQSIQQIELAEKASVPLPTYKDFLYKHKISLESLIKILIALRLFKNIDGLLKEKEYVSLDEIKNKQKLPKRIVK